MLDPDSVKLKYFCIDLLLRSLRVLIK